MSHSIFLSSFCFIQKKSAPNFQMIHFLTQRYITKKLFTSILLCLRPERFRQKKLNIHKDMFAYFLEKSWKLQFKIKRFSRCWTDGSVCGSEKSIFQLETFFQDFSLNTCVGGGGKINLTWFLFSVVGFEFDWKFILLKSMKRLRWQ